MVMRANLAALTTSIFVASAICSAQTTPEPAPVVGQAPYSAAYCSGFIKDTKVPEETRIVSGEQSSYKVVFAQGDLVIINHGESSGLRVGDRLMVVRPDVDPAKSEWFKGQFRIMSAMGSLYRDLGQLKIVNVQPKMSVAQVIFSCGMMQRGDIVRPFEERPLPPIKDSSTFDHFAPVSGKPVGTIVSAVDYAQAPGKGSTMYVNLGAAQGIKIGDYVRIFRHQGALNETAPVSKNYATEVYGFGSSPTRYDWKDLPREILGEGVVLNASRNAATVLVTFSSSDIYTGDNVEIE
jgi:hypothetical protein